MSWQLGAFVVLAIGLGAGVAWYERSKPDARVVALVGTLAAFAALGRIAFAAIPNVKPTSDIVLIAGFTLGGAPGYMVGAVAGLTSNFFFGQGPWTPWQMIGWGLTGIIGALIARATRGRMGRWPLAIISFALGFGFTALQDVGDWFNYSNHSLVQLGIYVGQGLGFDLVYAIGCFGFAFVFGPALIHALRRFNRRLSVTWLPSSTTVSALIAVALCGGVLAARTPAPASATAAPASAAAASHRSPLAYLQSAQNRDGGFGPARGQASTPLCTGWAVMAGAGGERAITYLRRTLAQDTDPGSIERTIIALRLAGQHASAFGGQDLVAKLERLVERNGSVSDQSNLTAFAVLALRAAQVTPPARMVNWLARQQDADGGFNYATAGAASDVDDTGAVLEALARTGHSRQIARALAFIRGQQNRDGGFPATAHSSSNAQSTAFAVQGLIAVGVNPNELRRHGSRSPMQYLRSLINPNGAVNYGINDPQTPVWVTAQAQLALAGTTL